MCTLDNHTIFIQPTNKSNPKPNTMKNVYLRISQGILFFSLQLNNYNTLQALCPYGSPSRQVACDHCEVEMSRDSIHFTSQGRVDGSNEINIQYKFPYIARQQEERNLLFQNKTDLCQWLQSFFRYTYCYAEKLPYIRFYSVSKSIKWHYWYQI